MDLFGPKPFAECHGFSFGMKTDEGKPINKPWYVATTDDTMRDELDRWRCPGHGAHAPCAGKYTKMTEDYTDLMVQTIHKAWKRSCRKFSNQNTKITRSINFNTKDHKWCKRDDRNHSKRIFR